MNIATSAPGVLCLYTLKAAEPEYVDQPGGNKFCDQDVVLQQTLPLLAAGCLALKPDSQH